MSEVEPQLTEEEELILSLGGQITAGMRLAARVLEKAGVYNVLCPACGHGVAGVFLARRGFQVTAYDISETAVSRTEVFAQRLGVKVDAFVDDVVIPHRKLRRFDALYSANLLNTMLAPQRRRLLHNFFRCLRQGGVLVVSVLSIEDERYGLGRPAEEDTFEVGPGEVVRFYSPPSLQQELNEFFEVTGIEDAEEVEEHGMIGRQYYRLLIATALKVSPD
jgi:SAM-dependent methyltransferase